MARRLANVCRRVWGVTSLRPADVQAWRKAVRIERIARNSTTVFTTGGTVVPLAVAAK